MGDGTGYSSPIIGGLGALIRDWIRSRNYVPGVSGWQIEANGNAEFNDVVVRGTVDVGGAPNPEVKIDTFPSLAQAAIALYTHGTGETQPGYILASFTGANELALFLYSPEHNSDGQIDLSLVAPENPRINTFYPARNTGGRFDHNNPSPGVALAAFNDGTGIFVDDAGLDVVGVAVNKIVPLQLGIWTGTNLRLGPDQIQAANNGVVSNLFINSAGGSVFFGAAVDVGAKLTADNLQSGSAITPGDPSFTSSVAVSFPHAFAGTPHVVCSPTSVVGQIDAWTATTISASGFTLTCKRTNNASTGFNWIAYDN